MLEHRADPDISSRYGVTPLSLAVANGSTDMVTTLLEAGADANTREQSGEPVLLSAAAVGEVGPVSALLAHEAVLEARDPNFHQTALMIAARQWHEDVVAYLLAAEADPNAAKPLLVRSAGSDTIHSVATILASASFVVARQPTAVVATPLPA